MANYTRAHMVTIADTIHSLPDNPTKRDIVSAFAAMLQNSNPKFKRALFEAACGPTSPSKLLTTTPRRSRQR